MKINQQLFMEMNASKSQNREHVNTIMNPTGFQFSYPPLFTTSVSAAVVEAAV
jgi:hypothetical protein